MKREFNEMDGKENLSRKEQIDREIDDELRFHLEAKIERYVRSGMSPQEARRKAMDRFGNFDLIRERVREVDLGLLEAAWQDVRYAVRSLAKSPGFTTAALLSLALGIGLNSAIFSAIDSVLLRPLPYREPDRIARIYHVFTKYPNGTFTISPANYLDWEKQNHVFEAMAAYERFPERFPLVAADVPVEAQALRVSASFFPVLGVQAALGRTFLAEEDKPGSAVAVLSHELWERLFHADPHVLSRSLTLNDAPYRIIGVLPANFRFFVNRGEDGLEPDLWLPHPFENNLPTNRGNFTLGAIGRLKTGVTFEQAQSDMQVISERLAREYPVNNAGSTARLVPLIEDMAGSARGPLMLLLAAVGMVLLIACANVANLLLARAGGRRREIAIRTAIGAPRPRLVRQVLTESLLLGLGGGAAGIWLALWTAGLLHGILPGTIFRLNEAGIDEKVLAFTLTVSLLSGVAFGMAPALQGSRIDVVGAFGSAGRSASEDRSSVRLRGILVVLQTAVSLVLLVGAGLMINSLWRLHQVRLGFRTDHLLTFRCDLPQAPPYARFLRFSQPRPGSNRIRAWEVTPRGVQFPDQVIEQIQRLPDVEAAAAVVNWLPFARDGGGGWSFRMDGQEARNDAAETHKMKAVLWRVTPGYFRTLGIRCDVGRTFDERDTGDAPGVAVVDRTMARTLQPNGASVIGKRIIYDWGPWEGERAYEIVGVAEDTKSSPKPGPEGHVYIPQAQFFRISSQLSTAARLRFSFVVRTHSDPASLVTAVRNVVRGIDNGQPVEDIESMDDVVAEVFGPWRSALQLYGLFGGLALLLSTIGIYGIVSYGAAHRTHEVGVRMAMGARRGQVVLLIMRRGVSLALAGTAVGTGAACWLTRWIAHQLYGVGATDPLTFAAVVVLLLGVASFACYLPARRAARLDPISALRCD